MIRTALLLVDLQKWIVGLDLSPISGPTVVERCAAMSDHSRSTGTTVAFIRYLRHGPMTPDDEWTPRLMPSADDLVVSKGGIDAFAGTDLHHRLAELDVAQVFIAGIATAHGVAATAQTARRLGHRTAVIIDAVASLNLAEHEAATAVLESSGVGLVTMSVVEVLLSEQSPA